mmetsp:Transcript_55413/g.173848  ORF Transcript_55413/g.173848 Transcript_55413/m.173848 type:complete len:214 (-) Transcript_55413:537-1178(-)
MSSGSRRRTITWRRPPRCRLPRAAKWHVYGTSNVQRSSSQSASPQHRSSAASCQSPRKRCAAGPCAAGGGGRALASFAAWPGLRNEDIWKPLKSTRPSGSVVSFSISQPSAQPQSGSNSSSTSPSLMPAARTLSDARAWKTSGDSSRSKERAARLRGHSRLEERLRRFTRTRRWPGATLPRLTGSASLALFSTTGWPLPPAKVRALIAATSLL